MTMQKGNNSHQFNSSQEIPTVSCSAASKHELLILMLLLMGQEGVSAPIKVTSQGQPGLKSGHQGYASLTHVTGPCCRQ